MSQRLRTISGVLVLAALAGFAALLAPAYYRNWQFQQYLLDAAAAAADSAPPEVLEVRVRDRAARLGVPLLRSDLKIERKPSGGWRIEALYVVQVDLLVYTVDLHFRPRAG